MERIFLPDFRLHKNLNGKDMLKKQLLPQHKALNRELDSLVKKHIEVLGKLQRKKEKGIMAMAAITNCARALQNVKTEKPSKNLNSQIKKLEGKLKKYSKREEKARTKYERLLKQERELVEKIKQTSVRACQATGDLYESHVQTLVSSLTDFASLTDTPASCSSAVNILQSSVSELVNSTLALTSRLYIFPNIHAWHKKYGFLEKIPVSFVRASAADIARNPLKALTAENRLAAQMMSSSGLTFPACILWVSKTEHQTSGDTNNNTVVAAGRSCGCGYNSEEHVKFLNDVYVRVIRPFHPTHPEHLKLKLGMLVKQKFPADKMGMAYGWTRSNVGAQKTYGFYPADHVILED